MPNWCENKLTVRGTKEALNKFLTECFSVDSYGDKYLDFNKIIPEPLVPQDCESLYIIPQGENINLAFDDERTWFNWYSWHCNKWGTKWNSAHCFICEPEDILRESLTEISIWFDTAWSPCRPIINKLIDIYTNLNFDYCFFEPGNWFGGRTTYSDQGVYYEEDYDGDTLKQFSIDEDFISQEYYDELESEE